jgi:valyl-tRNA synthetase
VSRQLWWGHRIPAYFARIKSDVSNGIRVDKNDPANNHHWIVARTIDDAMRKAAELLKTSVDNIYLEQDEDVLDTWFSSGLFPFSVFGWPNQTEDLKNFYPTTVSSLLDSLQFDVIV